MAFAINIFATVLYLFGATMQIDSSPKETFIIKFPKGGEFQFEVWNPETVKSELSQGNWEFEKKLSGKWNLELYENPNGNILQIFPGVRLGFFLAEESDLQMINSRVVPFVSGKGKVCPFLLIEKDEVKILLDSPGTTHLANIKERGEIDVYLLADKRVLSVHKIGGEGDLYLQLSDFQTVEREMNGFDPIIAVPGEIKEKK
ncbi:MAG: hypothetical protein AAF998_06840 [Bacteroidota bacterium]